jgi:hypothetical protein
MSQISGRRQSLARLGLALGDGTTNLGGYALVEGVAIVR